MVPGKTPGRAFFLLPNDTVHLRRPNAACVIVCCAVRAPGVLRRIVVLNATSTAVRFVGSKYMNARKPA